ncbi:type III pantothenate kinase [Ruminiclostridium sufflavum DSM 19573]|uniref:Type III pantothenate kinase n=1 Tax=Ruminiclostridium sufflavum DSM 19573 TaxID=1121337 RepID=A0A318XGT2_9FIRM|nr:type III pantothenate kinase [Ruminiclostridium sufflavum]PYG85755.1 type III pantothenate kinase [Ruminiclostridium sufflavum DSM 19573]
MDIILAIDIGNTTVVIGCMINGKVIFSGRVDSNGNYSCDDYAAYIKNILAKANIDTNDIKGSIISSVVPKLTNALKKAVVIVTNTIPLIAGAGLKTNLNIMVQNPEQLGSDRIVDAVAAVHYYSKPVIIFDMGTATTVSVVDDGWNFRGGLIMLGVKSALEALSNRASQLPAVNLEECGNIIGKNTIECMQSGSIYGHAAMVDGIIRKLKKQVGKHPTVIATGGLARLIVPHCEEKIFYDENLLLKGLYLLYEKNC